MPTYIFYPPPMPQGSIPPRVTFPISPAPGAPDNPPLLSHVYKYILLQTWQPGLFWRGNLQNRKVPLTPGDTTGDNPPFHREDTLNRINLSWYTPSIQYQQEGKIAHTILNVDDQP